MDPVVVKGWADKVLAALGFLAKWTPNENDDKIVAFLKTAVDNPDFMALFVALINLFQTNKHVTTEDLIAVMRRHGHLS